MNHSTLMFKMLISQKKLKHFRQFRYLSSAFFVVNIAHVSTSVRKYKVCCLSWDTEWMWKIWFLVWMRRARIGAWSAVLGRWDGWAGMRWGNKEEGSSFRLFRTWSCHQVLGTSRGIRRNPGYRHCFVFSSGTMDKSLNFPGFYHLLCRDNETLSPF